MCPSVVAGWLHRWSGRLGWPQVPLVMRACLCRWCWLLFIRTWSQVLGCRTPGGSGASADSLVNGIRIPKTLGLFSPKGKWSHVLETVLDYWQAGDPWQAGISELISNLCWLRESWQSGIWGPGSPTLCVGLIVDRARTQLFPGYGLACYCQTQSVGS